MGFIKYQKGAVTPLNHDLVTVNGKSTCKNCGQNYKTSSICPGVTNAGK